MSVSFWVIGLFVGSTGEPHCTDRSAQYVLAPTIYGKRVNYVTQILTQVFDGPAFYHMHYILKDVRSTTCVKL